MSIRFAAPPSVAPARMCLVRMCELSLLAVNDNEGEGFSAGANRTAIHEALRHFAQHGLDAAEAAGRQAEQAAREGDDEAFRWWFGICRTLDRRLAQELRTRRELEADAAGSVHP